ncbi:tyrosine decarboxylase MfnA [Candidatus Bathyarchaeota archaeon]|nr:tyrosine decarboxylase MfnA [Candidatus Bathyarchaeota archaeon]
MILQEEPIDQTAVIQALRDLLDKDEQYQSGRILGSMCTYPNEFAQRLASMFPEKNLGDPGLFPGTARLEDEAIKMMGEILGSGSVVGNMTTGGSEANIIAMRVARNLRPLPDPEVILPETAHASFFKAADFMGFKPRILEVDDNFMIDLGDLESTLNHNTIAVVGIAGTTALGLVDPIDQMGKIINDFDPGIYFHIDAAFGGFVLPFMRDMGHSFHPYDFSVNAVKSMTSDPHKMGTNLIPSGGFIMRESVYRDGLGFDIPYLAGGAIKHFNIMGTRPGSVVVAFWGLMKHLGRKGFREIVSGCWENTKYFRERIREHESYLNVVVEPIINVIGIKSETRTPITEVDRLLRKKGWYLGLFKNMEPPLIRVVVMPHITRNAIDAFFDDLESILKELHG